MAERRGHRARDPLQARVRGGLSRDSAREAPLHRGERIGEVPAVRLAPVVSAQLGAARLELALEGERLAPQAAVAVGLALRSIGDK